MQESTARELETIGCVAIDPRDADRLFAATDHAGFSGFTTRIYQSSDGGENWSLRLSADVAAVR